MPDTGGLISVLSECVEGGRDGEEGREAGVEEKRKREDRKYRESENPGGKEQEVENGLKCIYFKYPACHSPSTPSLPAGASQPRVLLVLSPSYSTPRSALPSAALMNQLRLMPLLNSTTASTLTSRSPVLHATTKVIFLKQKVNLPLYISNGFLLFTGHRPVLLTELQ